MATDARAQRRLPVRRAGARRRGFTLIELLVVVAVLSATALLALAVVTHDQNDLRRGDTAQRLAILRHGILGASLPVYDGQMRLSGFVADNGRLPRSIDELANGKLDAAATTALPDYQTVFHPTPASLPSACDATGVLAGTTGQAAYSLQKGWRRGYLGANDGTFRDGWSNHGAGDDGANFGWLVQSIATGGSGAPVDALNLVSYGANNVADPPVGGYPQPITDASLAFPATTPAENADMGIGIGANDWLADIDGWRIDIVNRRRTVGAVSGDLTVATFTPTLLVAHAETDGVRWTSVVGAPATLSTLGATCLDANGDGVLNDGASADPPQSCDASSVALTFVPAGAGAGLCAGRIPVGRHLLVLVWSGQGADGTSVADTRLVQPVAFYPGTGNPAATMELR